MKQFKYYLKSVALVTALGAFATSCDKTEDISTNMPTQSPLVSITANTQVSDTKVTYEDDATNKKMVVKWAKDDAFKLYNSAGVAEGANFKLEDSDAGKTSGTFIGTASDGTYTAFFPSQTPAATWSTLTVDYLNQTQDGDNSHAHLASKNYMIASGITIANNTSASNIAFKHLGCVLQFTITMPSGYTVKANGAPVELIITAPGMSSDIKPSAPSATGTLVSTQVLKLKNVTPDGNGKFTAYLMSAPFTIPQYGSLTITVGCQKPNDGPTHSYVFTKTFSAEQKYTAGKRYKFDLSGNEAVSAGEDYVEIGGVKWATGNIVKVVNQTSNKLSFAEEAHHQGLVFKWGSLIGVNMKGSNNVTFAADAIVFVPSEYTTAHSSASITTWVGPTGIPYEDELTEDGNLSADKDAFHRLYPTTGYDASEGKGDICRYMSAQGWIKGKWRMPTSAEFGKLNAQGANSQPTTTWSAVSPTDVNGQDVISQGYFFGTGAGNGTTSNMDTPLPNSIFLPAGGYRSSGNGTLYTMGSLGYYWSCSPISGIDGYNLYFLSSGVTPGDYFYRDYGFPVRCVLE